MNPDNIALQNAFNSFIADYGQNPESRLLIYFAGHGYTKKMAYGDNLGYILPANCPNPETNPNDFQIRAMPMGQIELFATQIQAKHALFMFDACFSGSVFTPSREVPEVITYKTTRPVRQFITSGSADETVPDKSIFRRQFIAAINGEADYNKDGFVTGTELGDFLQTQVINYSKNSQHPQFGKIQNPNLDKGDFVFLISSASNIPVVSATIDENPNVTNGKIEITTPVGGTLYLDDISIRTVGANTVVPLNNITAGLHKITIRGDKNLERSVEVKADQISYLVFDKRKDVIAAELAPPMVFVEGGKFLMGSNDGSNDEKPVHAVAVNSFYIGEYEVTQEQWRNIMGSNAPDYNGCDNCPVVSVSWYYIQDFLKVLNTKTGGNYRLPTEAEWEFAAKGGVKGMGYKYSGSDNVDEIAWYEDNSDNKTHPVGRKHPNELGIYDMSGNVLEFCIDRYDRKYYKYSPSDNPQGPSSGSFLVIRGGSFNGKPTMVRATSRQSIDFPYLGDPNDHQINTGFRICRTY
jgi:formylglycine-generating enzyme required for sulfatase activity